MAPKRRSEHAPSSADALAESASTSEHTETSTTPYSHSSELRDEVLAHLERLDSVLTRKSVPEGISLGFRDLDVLTGKFRAGEVVVVAGRPSMGKTAFALNVIANVGLDSNEPAILFSLESTMDSVVSRMVSSEARVSPIRARRGKLVDDEVVRMGQAAGRLSASKVWIDELPTRSFDEMVSKVREAQRTHGIALVVIDYLQLLEGPMPRAENRTQELSAMSRALKGLAKELRITIIVLSQCSRAPEQRVHHWPVLTDVRDSGAIEEDADVVIFLYRQEIYDGPYDRDGNPIDGRAEVIVAKNRGGATGFVRLYFNKVCVRFETCDQPGAAA